MERKENNCLVGIIGAIIGGMIATLPWILCYVYANMMYAILTVIVAMGALKGYQLLKGKVDKKLPVIIAVISFACITVATLVIIPNLLLIKEYGSTSMELFKALYTIDEFKSAIMQDYIYTVVFTILGIWGVIANINKQIKDGATEIDLSKNALEPSGEKIEAVKKVFTDAKATDKDNTISKDELMEKIKGHEDTLKYLVSRGIIVKKNKSYYYSLANEINPGKRLLKITLITFGIVFLVLLLIFILI